MSNQRTPSFIPHAGVICRQHGAIDIDKADYIRQMYDADSKWKCPICKQNAEFNDARYEELHPQEE